MDELWGQYVSLIFPTKTPMGKIENMTHFCIDIASLKTFYEKPLWGKLIEGKEYNMMFEQVIIQEKTPPEPCNSQSHWIPIPWNMDVGMDLVSESAKWLQDYFGKMFISQYGDKTFWTIIYALIWPVSILTIQATLSLQIMVGDSMESHLITLWSHAYVILQNDKWKQPLESNLMTRVCGDSTIIKSVCNMAWGLNSQWYSLPYGYLWISLDSHPSVL